MINDYDQFLIPPNIQICLDHEKASLVRPLSYNLPLCACCTQPISGEQYPMSVQMTDLTKQVGLGTIVFFKYLSICKYMALTLFVTYGIPSFITNLVGQYCDKGTKDTNQLNCTGTYVAVTSFLNKWDEKTTILIQGVFGIINTFIMLYIIWKYRQILKEKLELSEVNDVKAGDYTLVARNLPKGQFCQKELEDEIHDWYNYQTRRSKNIPVKQQIQENLFFQDLKIYVNLAYDLKEQITAEKDIKLMKRQIVKIQSYQLQKKDKNAYPKKWDRQSYALLQNRLQSAIRRNNKFKDDIAKGTVFDTPSVAFISFKHIECKKYIKIKTYVEKLFFQKKCDLNVIERKLYELEDACCGCCCGRSNALNFNGHVFNLEGAAEPSDIIWSNTGFSHFYRMLRQFFVIIATLGLILLNFISIYYINKVSQTFNDNTNDFTYNQKIRTTIVSFTISIINKVIIFLVTYLGNWPKFDTYTNLIIFQSRIISITLFLNTVGLPIFVNLLIYYVNGIVSRQQLFTQLSGVMLSDMFYVGVSQSVLSLIMDFFNPWYFFKLSKRRQLIKDQGKVLVTQGEANKTFEGEILSFQGQIASANVLIWMGAFYSPLLPQLSLFVLVSVLINYYLQKYLLIRRYKKPRQISGIIKNIYLQSARIAIFLFGIGCALLQSCYQYDIFVFDDKNNFKNSQMIIYYLPLTIIILTFFLEYIFQSCLRGDKVLDISDRLDKRTYFELKNYFLEDYDRENPYTKDQATKKLLHQDKTDQSTNSQKKDNKKDKDKKKKDSKKKVKDLESNYDARYNRLK